MTPPETKTAAMTPPETTPTSPRLEWHRLAPEYIDVFYRLVRDAHVKRYLLDGLDLPRAWCDGEIEASDRLFEAHGVGLWLVRRPGDPDMVGFAGYRIFEEMGPEPQLLYAFVERVTGRGLATEVARALVAVGHAAGLDPIHSAVDGPNLASMRVLEKAGFEKVRTTAEGVFGETAWFERRADPVSG